MNAISIDIHPGVDCIVRVTEDGPGRTIHVVPGSGRLDTRPAASSSRFTRSDVIVHDALTGLTWTDTISDERVNHQQAKQLAAECRIGDHSDWRLPTIQELLSLVDYERSDPAIDTAAFPDTKSAWYWSTSALAADPGRAWIVYFHLGSADYYHRDLDDGFVRAVRGPASGKGGGR